MTCGLAGDGWATPEHGRREKRRRGSCEPRRIQAGRGACPRAYGRK
jgi:hypothetical protein